MPVDISEVRSSDSPSGPLARAQFPGKKILRDPSIACGQHFVFYQIRPGSGEYVCLTVSVQMRLEKGNSGNHGTREAGEPEGRWRGALSRVGGGFKSMGPGGSHLGSTPYQFGDSLNLSFLVCKMGE